MPPFESILAVLFAGIALSATPGPSMLYVLSRTVGQSRAAGLASAVGLALGGVILAVATALGLAALFAQFDWMIVTLRYVGSAYLVYLGVGMIRDVTGSAPVTIEARQVTQRSFFDIVRQGVVVEVLNPKTVLFFALFLPPFVDAGQGDDTVQTQLLVLGVLVPLTAIPTDILVAYMGGRLTQSVNKHRGVQQGMAWVGGLLLILIAVNLHLGFI